MENRGFSVLALRVFTQGRKIKSNGPSVETAKSGDGEDESRNRYSEQRHRRERERGREMGIS